MTTAELLTSSLMLVLATGFINFLAWGGKQFGISAKHALALGAVLVAVIYTAFDLYTPPDVKTHIITFASTAGFFAVLFYEYFLKRADGK